MESALIGYILSLILIGLGIMGESAEQIIGLFAVAILILTKAVCLGWLGYLTYKDWKERGCCPKDEAEVHDVGEGAVKSG